jgi:hypothetical protein
MMPNTLSPGLPCAQDKTIAQNTFLCCDKTKHRTHAMELIEEKSARYTRKRQKTAMSLKHALWRMLFVAIIVVFG